MKDELDEYLRELVIGIAVDGKFSPVHEAIDRFRGVLDPRAEGAWQASNTIAEIYRNGLENAVERDDEKTYNRIREQAESGSVEFTNAAQAQDYIDRVEDALDGIDWENGSMAATHHAAAGVRPWPRQQPPDGLLSPLVRGTQDGQEVK